MDTIVLCTVLISLLLLGYDVNSQLSEGDACSGDNGQTWRCKKLQNCPTAIAEIKFKRPIPCGVSADSFVVCCNPNFSKPNKPPENFIKPKQPQTQTQAPYKPPPKKQPQTNLPATISEIKCREYKKYVYKEVSYAPLGLDVDYDDDEPKKLNQSLENTCGYKTEPLIFDECREYQKYVYKEVSYVPLALEVEYEDEVPINSNKPTENTCGFNKEPLIFDGKPARPREFPHQAMIGYEIKKTIGWKCSGSLISERFVLTAAHCLDTTNGPAKWVRTGDLDYSTEDDQANPQQIRVLKRIEHPRYRNERPFNDIGLLQLERAVKLDEFSRPACLHTEYALYDNNATASGWGYTENGTLSTFLLKVQLEIVERNKCNDYYKENLSIDDKRMICAGDFVGRKNTCKGDSGGPLQVRRTSPYCMYDIIGVTSFGRGRCGSSQPGVYARVSHYLDWIESHVWP